MAYCNKCGAYIPDGQTKCLACGFDEAEEQKKAAQSSSAAAGREARRDTGKYYSFSSEEMRRELEERRKKQQEQSRIWAEQESARRAERQRSEAQYRRDANENGTYSAPAETQGTSGRDESRLFAALSYISVLFLLPYFLRRGDDYAMYHARQGLVLLIYGVLSDILSAIPVIGWVFGLFRLYCVFKGISNAVTGKREPLPYIGKYGERIG